MKTLALTILLIFTLQSFADCQIQPNVSELMARADSLRDHYKETEALNQYLKVLQVDSTNFRALWSAGFLYTRVGNRLSDRDRKIAYFRKAEILARKALKIDSTNAYSNWTMSVVFGRMAMVSDAKKRIALSRYIKYYAQKALSYDPRLAGAWYVLGKWNYRVANLSFAERMAARLLYGGVPSGASNQKAIEDYKKAIDFDGDKLLYWLDLATVYRKTGDKTNEKAALQQLLKLPVKSPDDPGYAARAREMLQAMD